MLIQLANIIAGFVLAAPKLRELFAKEHITEVSGKIEPYRGTIGIAVLILGAIALVERLSIVYIGGIGSSFPQALIAVAMGLLLAPHLFEKYPAVHELSKKLEPHAEWVGIAGIAVGLGSMLFGCVAPVCYHF